MTEKISKIWKAVTSILVAIAVILAVLLAGVRVFGFQPYTVLSPSMEPTYSTGSIIYVKKTDPANIEAGTPLTFMLNGTTIVTHRVIEVVPDESDKSVHWFRTKGDANAAADGALVHQNNVLGVPRFSIPYLGYVANYIQNPPGKYIAISLCALLILVTFLPHLFSDDEENEKKKKKKNKGKK